MSAPDPTTDDSATDSTNSAATTDPSTAGDGPDRDGPGGNRPDVDGPAPGDGPDGDDLGIGEDYPVPDWLSLDPDEEIVWVGEPVMLSLVGTAVVGVILIPFLIGILVLLALPFSYLSIENTDFVVTTKSLYVKKGIASTSIETVDIDKIQNTEYNQSFWGKQFDYANIDVSTAGSSGAEITFQSISNARAVRERISELGNRARRDAGGGSGETDERGRAGDDRLDELVAELRATREAMERIEAKLGEGERPGGERRRTDDTVDGAARETDGTAGSGAHGPDGATDGAGDRR